MVGQVIAGKYRVLDVLGQGGFGTVYLVEIVAGMVGEKLALKMIRTDLSSRPSFREKFLDEIRIAMKVVDKHIVQIRDVGTRDDGQLYYTMDYCPGTTLRKILRREVKLAISRALALVSKLLRALQTSHGRGIIHRDLKPANLMVFEEDGQESLRVLDFGIAMVLRESTEQPKRTAGSPHYMAPEQITGASLGFYTDLYAVGVILYECVTGRKPYPGKVAEEIFRKRNQGPPPPPEQFTRDLLDYPGLSELIMKALEFDPQRRFQMAEELLETINATLAVDEALTPHGSPEAEGMPALSRGAAPISARRGGAAARTRRSRRRLASEPHVWVVPLVAVLGTALLLPVVLHQAVFREGNEDNHISAIEQPRSRESEERGSSPSDSTRESSRVLPTRSGSEVNMERSLQGEQASLAKQKRQAQSRLTVSLLRRAREAIEREDWAEVAKHAARVTQLDSDHSGALRLLGFALLRLGEVDRALEKLEKVRQGHRDSELDREFLLMLAEAQTRASIPRFENAEFHLKLLLRKSPKDGEAIVLLAKVFEARGMVDKLKRLVAAARKGGVVEPELQRLWRRFSTAESPSQRKEASRLLREARREFWRGNYEAAVKLAGKVTEKVVSDEADLVAAESYLELKQESRGLALLEEVEERRSSSNKAKGASGNQGSGVTAPQEPPLLGPWLDYLDGRKRLLEFAETADKQKLEQAEAAFTLAITKASQLQTEGEELASFGRLWRARARVLRGDFQNVVNDLEKIRDGDVTSPVLLVTKGRVYLLAAKTAKLKKQAIRACQLAKKSLAAVLKNRGGTAKLQGEAHFLTGRCYWRLGDLTGSHRYFKLASSSFLDAIHAGRRTVEVYRSRAQVLERLGELFRAAESYRQVYELNPTSKNCLQAAECYLKTNSRSSHALAVLKDGLKRFPENRKLKRKYAQLAGE